MCIIPENGNENETVKTKKKDAAEQGAMLINVTKLCFSFAWQ